jgi:hypothetical protein
VCRPPDLVSYAHTLPSSTEQRSSLNSKLSQVVVSYWLPANHPEVIATVRRLTGEIGAQYSLTFITERRPRSRIGGVLKSFQRDRVQASARAAATSSSR